jgi:uncharacterized protein YccT (UPF0319 family)
MRKNIFNENDVTIFMQDGKFFIRYDVGSHQIVIREDEISEKEAMQVIENSNKVIEVLFSLQKRLLLAGVDPYVSNIGKN